MLFKRIMKYQHTKSFMLFILFLMTAFLVTMYGCVSTETSQVPTEKVPHLEDSKIVKIIMKDGSVKDVAMCNASFFSTYKEQKNVIVYTNTDTLSTGPGSYKISYKEKIVSMNDVFSVVIEKDEVNGGMTILAVTGIGLLIAMIVIAASDPVPNNSPPPPPASGNGGQIMSCPFVYTFNGSEFVLESETFAGAIIKPAERTSYDNLLHVQPVNGKVILKLAAEMPETEFTNELNVTAVDTREDVKIITDYKNEFHSVSRGEEPLTCTDLKGNDVKNTIVSGDGKYWRSDIKNMNLAHEENLRDGLILEFAKPEPVSTAKIVVKGINTMLTVAAFEEIYRLQGTNKSAWLEELEKNPAEAKKLAGFLKREGMLHVMLWENGKWVEQSIIRDPGPVVEKEQLAVVDLSKINGNTFKVKLESTTDLWKIDRVYADYSNDAQMEVRGLEMFSATDQNGNDVRDALNSQDDKYLTAVPGNYTIVVFNDISRASGMYRHYMLRSGGYYHPWYETTNEADKKLYNKVMNEPMYGAKYFMNQWKQRTELNK